MPRNSLYSTELKSPGSPKRGSRRGRDSWSSWMFLSLETNAPFMPRVFRNRSNLASIRCPCVSCALRRGIRPTDPPCLYSRHRSFTGTSETHVPAARDVTFSRVCGLPQSGKLIDTPLSSGIPQSTGEFRLLETKKQGSYRSIGFVPFGVVV